MASEVARDEQGCGPRWPRMWPEMNRQPEGRQVTNYLCLTKNSNNGNKESTLSVLPEDRQVEQPQEVRQVLRKAIQPHRAGHARTGRAHDRSRRHR